MTPADQNTRLRTQPRFRQRRASRIFAVSLALVASGCVNNTPADTWVIQNQNLQNTRYVGGRITTGTIDNVAVAWTADVKTANGFGDDASDPLISKEFVFVRGANGRILAFDRFTGRKAPAATKIANKVDSPEWLAETSRSAATESSSSRTCRFSPTPTSPTLTTAPRSSSTAARRARSSLSTRTVAKPNGAARSRARTTPSPRVVSRMAAANNSIFAPVVNVPDADSDDSIDDVYDATTKSDEVSGQLVSINAENGKVNWTKKLASAPLGGVTVVNNIAFVTTVNGNIYGFDRDGGDQVWTSELPAGSAAPISASDDLLIVPASLVFKKGQKAQVVAFRIGGLGAEGAAEAPKLQQAEEPKRAEAHRGRWRRGRSRWRRGQDNLHRELWRLPHARRRRHQRRRRPEPRRPQAQRSARSPRP